MEVTIEAVTNKKTIYKVKATDLIKDFKQIIQQDQSVSAKNPKLYYNGQELSNDKTFGDYSIKHGSTIYLFRSSRITNSDFTIRIFTSNGRIIPILAGEHEKINTLKLKIQEKTGIPIEDQILYQGDRNIISCVIYAGMIDNIREGSCFLLVTKKEQEMDEIQIVFELPNQTNFTLNLKPSEQIIEVKKKIHEITKITPSRQRLSFNGKQLNDYLNLLYYSFCSGSTIKVDFEELPPEGDMIVKVGPLTGLHAPVFVKPTYTIRQLRLLAESRHNIDPDSYNIIYRGRMVDDKSTIQKLEIQNYEYVHCVFTTKHEKYLNWDP